MATTDRITYRDGEIRVGGKLFASLWIPSGGGYVRDVSRGTGTLAPQVSEDLTSSGNMLEARAFVGSDGVEVSAIENMNRQMRRILRRESVRQYLRNWLDFSSMIG